MITENLSTLKIHKLTQAQYDRELAADNIDENALYLTPMDIIVPPTTAEIGQTIVVKSVDETGKPTEWEAVDNLRYVASDTEPDDKNVVWIDTTDGSGDLQQISVDSTLTQIGHAADAKVTGDAIGQLTPTFNEFKKIYIGDSAPIDTTDGTIWVDTSE